jgi:hypothetical protein
MFGKSKQELALQFGVRVVDVEPVIRDGELFPSVNFELEGRRLMQTLHSVKSRDSTPAQQRL